MKIFRIWLLDRENPEYMYKFRDDSLERWDGGFVVFDEITKRFYYITSFAKGDIEESFGDYIPYHMVKWRGVYIAFNNVPYCARAGVHFRGLTPFVKVRVGRDWVYEIARDCVNGVVGGVINVIDKSLFIGYKMYDKYSGFFKASVSYPSFYEIRWDDMVVFDIDLAELPSGRLLCLVLFLDTSANDDVKLVYRIFDSLDDLKSEIESGGYVDWSEVYFPEDWGGGVPLSFNFVKLGGDLFLSVYGLNSSSQVEWSLLGIVEKESEVEFRDL
jgi:hypothetical protein